MSDAFWVALIGGVVSIVGIVVGAYVSIRGMIKQTSQQIQSNGIQVAAVKQIAERTSKEVVRSKDEIDLMKTGAFHRGVKAGQKHESDFQRLHGKSSDLGGLY